MESNAYNSTTEEIVLGKPSAGCQGHGICRILTQSMAKSIKCPSVTAIIDLGENDKLQFSFLKTALSTQAKEKHFSSQLFKIEEPLVLPARLKTRLPGQLHCIMPGQYNITENEHFYVITF